MSCTNTPSSFSCPQSLASFDSISPAYCCTCVQLADSSWSRKLCPSASLRLLAASMAGSIPVAITLNPDLASTYAFPLNWTMDVLVSITSTSTWPQGLFLIVDFDIFPAPTLNATNTAPLLVPTAASSAVDWYLLGGAPPLPSASPP
eukprot:CAMPEP_0113690264 /NCGR_PEP_ID=MMETSP0038_2-20120614/17678_1 /TAXON_ID=2898 /ORGANISM="Cryptomonas paramecium" /LENGTH=146 /DNA_ID=CAMNT_0000611537 /DNA_START=234 /DNA_END=671 /DNA_ORIENTATION=- /assembly_acc=CAM_ASM_000170